MIPRTYPLPRDTADGSLTPASDEVRALRPRDVYLVHRGLSVLFNVEAWESSDVDDSLKGLWIPAPKSSSHGGDCRCRRPCSRSWRHIRRGRACAHSRLRRGPRTAEPRRRRPSLERRPEGPVPARFVTPRATTRPPQPVHKPKKRGSARVHAGHPARLHTVRSTTSATRRRC